MKMALLFALVVVGIIAPCRAQPGRNAGDETLGHIATTLWFNNHPDQILFGTNMRRQAMRFDTMPQTGENLHQRAMFEPDMETAIALLEKSTQLDPKLHNTVGWSYLVAYHDYPRALYHLNAYDDLTPNFDDMDNMAPVSYLKGLCYRNMGNHTEAVREFSRGIDSLVRKHGVEWVNYKYFVSRAISYSALGQFDKALIDLDLATRNCTHDSPLILYHKGRVFEGQGRPTDAKRAFTDAKFFWQANNAKGISQPEDDYNLVLEDDIDEALKK